ncbi:CRISPR-associated endonuclease Cas1 [Neomoorella glycerini]|uniref:CRISPR-associated endonuclease Cas1 n=1 Tax=Neomoorella glycerini TaxID=55779 RepID=A0A6I5ZSK9_9FIRM|nr:type I-B CRISPR-associated endonuclease Cas1b [Moorella glycerini]QGP92361.1 CRISPR-associated endonuclease Cas1 [Moorella glycerini]
MKKTLYIFTNGQFHRKDNTIYFETEQGEKRFIPVEDTGEIMIFGEVDINKRFLEFLSQKEIILHYFSHYGYYMGSFYPREHLNSGYMILRQAEHYIDENKRLSIARLLVEGAGKNILRVLKYYKARDKKVDNSIVTIETLLGTIATCNDIPSLMAIEGNMREAYYKAFDEIIELPDFIFENRTRRPPKNYLNTLISFGNSLLYTICLGEIYRTHLDPRIGFLHTTNFRRFTLNLDIAEIFKPLIVDRVIFSLLGRKMITTDDFERGSEGILMKDRAKRCFIEQMEEKLKTTIKHREIGRAVSYRRLIRLELYKLEKHLMGEKVYEPFIATW